MSDQGIPSVELQVVWEPSASKVPTPVNQFMIVAGPGVPGIGTPDTYTVVLGHVAVPHIPQPKTQEEAARFSADNRAFVTPVAQVELTTSRVRELRDLLNQVVEKLDQK